MARYPVISTSVTALRVLGVPDSLSYGVRRRRK
jgi:hypothetical protein